MGKSTIGVHLEGLGIPVLDTDRVVGDLIQPGEVCLEEIFAEFGEEFRNSDGTLNRKMLAARVFDDPEARSRLEGILHPRVRKIWKDWLDRKEDSGHQAAAVLIPLLFETGTEQAFHFVICAACSHSAQFQRLKQRSWSENEIKGRIAAQMRVEEKMLRSQFVVWSDGARENYGSQLELVLKSVGIG